MEFLWRYGSCLYEDGRWDEAEKIDVQVMKICKEKLEADYPDILTSMANLAVIYGQHGRQDKAEKLMLQVIEI
jgi:hypothetical protein